jgi:hypothetical protein
MCDVHDYLDECDVYHGHRNENDVHDDFDTAIVMVPVMALMSTMSGHVVLDMQDVSDFSSVHNVMMTVMAEMALTL